LEILIFVLLADCLEPTSFKLEHWFKGKFINKAVHILKTVVEKKSFNFLNDFVTFPGM